MSRSDNTEWRRERKHLTYTEIFRITYYGKDSWGNWGLPAGTGQEWRRIYWKKQRAKVRAAIIHDYEPEPTRTRSSVKYDYW